MIKLTTPPGILFTVAMLVLYVGYAFRIGFIEDSWMLLMAGCVAVLATYGTAMLRPWSRYLVYILASGFISKIGYSIYAGVKSGYFAIQFDTTGAALKSLWPSAAMVLLSCACCLLVHRHFSSTAALPSEGQPGAPPRDGV